MLKNFILFLFTFFLISCNNNNEEYVPDYGPKNIKFEPKYGKVGDIITITGDDFPPLEDLNLYITNKKEYIQKYGYSYFLVKFNSNIYYNPERKSQLIIDGTGAIDYVEFDTNKIVCKIPDGAKTGKIWVDGAYTASLIELHHPSEEEFIVYDESEDIVR